MSYNVVARALSVSAGSFIASMNAARCPGACTSVIAAKVIQADLINFILPFARARKETRGNCTIRDGHTDVFKGHRIKNGRNLAHEG